MRNPAYILRNYHRGDFNKLVQLGAEVQELGQTWCPFSPLDLFESLNQSNHSPQTNVFIAEQEEEIVGYAEVRPEFTLGRVVLVFLVHPKHRRGGVAVKLAQRAIGRARELGVKIIHVNIWQNRAARQLLTQIGFVFVRRFLELRLDLSETHLPGFSQRAARCRPLQPGEEERLTQLQNRAFAGSWGYNANTVEGILYRIRLPNCSLEDIVLALDDTDQPIGYCWTRTAFGGNKALPEGTGRVYMLGVEPEYRGRGIGRQLLLAGLSYLKSKGLRVVELTVDRENKAARALYRSVGFRLWRSSLWYEKRLD